MKKPTLDPLDLNSYRPISNLTFVSKILERVINSRIADHAHSLGLFSPVQSAYRKHHSTETALVKIHNDLVDSVDKGQVGAIALLDLSSAFDTVDHLILFDVLQKRFGVTGPALPWFQSYLSNRTQTVLASGPSSSVTALNCGVPQGSVLGPKTFIAYTDDIFCSPCAATPLLRRRHTDVPRQQSEYADTCGQDDADLLLPAETSASDSASARS